MLKKVISTTLSNSSRVARNIRTVPAQQAKEVGSLFADKTLKQCRVLNEDYLELISTEKTLLFRIESYSVVCVEESKLYNQVCTVSYYSSTNLQIWDSKPADSQSND